MTGHRYLENILASQYMDDDDSNVKTMREMRQQIESILRAVYGYEPRFYYAGSYGKRTMIRKSFDLDIIIYFPSTVKDTLRDIYNSVHKTLKDANYVVIPKTVSLQLPYQNGFHIDVVPGRAYDSSYRYATLYKNGEGTTMQTSLKVHIESVRAYREIIKLMKLWKIYHSLNVETFALEQIVVRALKNESKYDHAVSLTKVFEFIRDYIQTIRVVDPANSNNIIEIPDTSRLSLYSQAKASLNSQFWSQVIW